jgi:hypothetical protein
MRLLLFTALLTAQHLVVRVAYRMGRSSAFHQLRRHYTKIGQLNTLMAVSILDYYASRQWWIQKHLVEAEEAHHQEPVTLDLESGSPPHAAMSSPFTTSRSSNHETQ